MSQNKRVVSILSFLGIRWSERKRIAKFLFVGFLGVILNEFLLWVLTEIYNIYYILSSVIAIEISIIFVFLLNEFFVFGDRRYGGTFMIFVRMFKSNLVRVLGMVINIITLFVLVEFFFFYYLVANLVGIALGTFVNYSLSFSWVWSQ